MSHLICVKSVHAHEVYAQKRQQVFGASCSKLTMSFVNDSLNFKHEYYKYTVIFC